MRPPIHDSDAAPSRSLWIAAGAFVGLVLGLVAFFATTVVKLDATFLGSGPKSFSFVFQSSMSVWYHVGLIVWFVAWVVTALVGIFRSSGWRGLLWSAAVLNGLSAALLTTFLLLAYAQRANAS